tara:strand:- start:21069 stop:21518 length:450 start_codon:yes stop_codon:yes gene_type:complete
MKLGAALKINDTLRVKKFALNGHVFKVKVPLGGELDFINKKMYEISDEEIKPRLEKMKKALEDVKADNIVVSEDDIVVDGKSIKETVTSVLYMEKKIVEYFRFLVPVEGNFNDLTYADIEAEFPLQIQLEMLEGISEAIQPGYKEAKKN